MEQLAGAEIELTPAQYIDLTNTFIPICKSSVPAGNLSKQVSPHIVDERGNHSSIHQSR